MTCLAHEAVVNLRSVEHRCSSHDDTVFAYHVVSYEDACLGHSLECGLADARCAVYLAVVVYPRVVYLASVGDFRPVAN